jgi:hypothetical protein
MADRPCLVEADLPIQDLVARADASGNAFTGRWIVRSLDSLRCSGLDLSSHLRDEVGRRFSNLGRCAGWNIRSEEVVGLDRIGIQSVHAIVVDQARPLPVTLSYAARLVSINRDLLIIPCVALHVQPIQEGVSTADHNRAVSNEWRRISLNSASWHGVMAVHEEIVTAIRMVLTARVAADMTIGGIAT